MSRRDEDILLEVEQGEWREQGKREQKGRVLAEDLATTLRVSRDNLICYTEMPTFEGGYMDVWAMKSGWGDRDVRCYEVKISRADYWNDVNAGKYERYLPFCKRFYFAVPSGLVKKSEVPEGCGLITRNDNGWRTVVPPTPHEAAGFTPDYFFALVREIYYREAKSPQRRLRERVFASENYADRPVVRDLGQEIARKVRIAERLTEQLGDEPGLEHYGARTHRDTDALRCLEAFEKLADDMGIGGRFREPEHLAEFAAAVIRNAESVREIGALLTRLPFKTLEDVQAVIAGRIEPESGSPF